jgi:tRNA threonylcarbamoyladenosine biosynthesis protein TsaB
MRLSQPRLILALDASSSRCSVVLWSEEPGAPAMLAGGRVLAGMEREGQTGDAARLPGMVAQLLASQGLAAGDLTAIAVSVGPGSFTGLRASLAFAEGVAAGARIPVIGVTVAEALAVAARAEDAAVADLPLWCALDARHGRLFLHRGGAPDAWEVAHLGDPPRPRMPVALTGDAAEALGDVLRNGGLPAIITAARLSHARAVAIAGLWRLQGRLPPLAATPLYVDPPRALVPKGGLRPPPREAASVS